MRSTSNKAAKPPPPIPPRPSKALVAESLAKIRRSPIENHDFEKPLSPTRLAPPPPQFDFIQNDVFIPVAKSQSHCTVNAINDNSRIHKIQRSASISEEDHKSNSRTVIFQSSNIKTSRLELKLKRNESDRKQRSEYTNNTINSSSSSDDLSNISNGVKSDAAVDMRNTDDLKVDEWDQLLNGKNHVNTLIDEMFASILDTPEDKKPIEALPEETEALHAPVDSTTIIIKSEINGNHHEVLTTTATITKEIPEHLTTVTIADISLENDPVNQDENEKNITTETDVLEKNKNNANRVKFDDKHNHELLITELQNMRMEQDRLLKRQRNSPQEFYDENDEVVTKIQHSDWVEVNDGQEVRLSSCQIIIEDDVNNVNSSTVADPIISRLNMSSLHGLPPLPKSLSGFSLLENQRNNHTPSRGTPVRGATPPSGFVTGQVVYPPHPRTVNGTSDIGIGRKATNLDNQLAILRREMYSLRQLDLSLLSQLWSLNESIQDFRQLLQDQDERALSPPSPSPSPSSCDDGDVDEFFSPSPMRMRPAPPPPPLRRTSNSSSATSSEYGTV